MVYVIRRGGGEKRRVVPMRPEASLLSGGLELILEAEAEYLLQLPLVP